MRLTRNYWPKGTLKVFWKGKEAWLYTSWRNSFPFENIPCYKRQEDGCLKLAVMIYNFWPFTFKVFQPGHTPNGA